MADSGEMFALPRLPAARLLTAVVFGAFVVVLSACSSSTTPAELTDTGPGRLALEPGDDPSEAADQLAVPTTAPPPESASDVDTEPSEALASTEAGEETTIDPEPGATTEAPDEEASGPVPTDFESLLDSLVSFVETERGHRFTSTPEVNQLGDAAFAAAVSDLIAADTDRYSAELTAQTQVQRALGVLAPDQNLADIQASFGDAGITALYDPNTGIVNVRNEAITPLLRTSLVFELTRALDDQEFDVRRPDGVEPVAEVEWSRNALAYGSASHITDRYRATMTAAELTQEQQQIDALPRNVSLSLFTNALLELQFGRQFYGSAAIDDHWQTGQAAVDAALADPPESSEALIAGNAADAPAAVDAPAADGPVLQRGVWGQAGWIALFSELVSPEEAEALAAGWGGDAFVTWEAGTSTCIRLHVTADSADALDRYADALRLWTEAGDRDLFFPTADLIRVTACG